MKKILQLLVMIYSIKNSCLNYLRHAAVFLQCAGLLSGRRNKNIFHALVFSALLLGSGSSAWALTTSAIKDLSCVGFRAGNTTCTAGEFTVSPVFSAAPGTPAFCVAGSNFNFQVELGLSGTNTDRMDIGFFVGQQGNDPRATTAGNICSVATFPKTPSPWIDVDSDGCGDFLGGGNQTTTINEIKVLCAGDTATGDLNMPYVVTYWQNNGNVCTGPADVSNGAPSKCNAGTGSVSGTIPVKVASYVDVTKATLPAGNTSQTFTYTATGPAGSKVGALVGTTFTPDNSAGNQPTNTVTVSITGGQTVRFFINATTAGQTLTITEAATTGWESTANAISCSPVTGSPSITTTPASRTITAGLSLTNNAASCTFTNQQSAKITLVKTVGGRVNSGDQFTVSASGGGTLQGTSSATTAGAATSASTTFYSSPGTALTLADVAAGTTVLGNYDSRLTCTNALSGTAGYTANASLPSSLSTTSSSITPLAGDDITCTYTNSPKPQVSLQKAISAAGGGRVASTDQFILAITGATPVTTTGTGSSVTSAAVSLAASAGTPITLSETAAATTPATDLANYTTTYACTNSGTGGTVVTSGTGTSFTFTPAANDVMACTFTNTRKSASLTLRKIWVNGVSGNTATVTSAGFANNASSGLSTSSGSNTTAGSAVTVYAGETGTISEAFGVGSSASYSAGLACSGNATPLSVSSLTVNVADTAIVCTLTNTGTRITLAKTVGGRVNSGDQFTVSASGGGTLQGTSSITTAGAATSASTIFYSSPGAALTLTDAAAGTTALSDYDSRLTCTNALSGTAGYTANASLPSSLSATSASITPVAGDDITCTYTNTPKPRISLQKVFAAAGGGRVASTDQFILAMTGATPVTTTGTGSSVASAAVSLVATAGTAITLSETAAATTPATNLANYTTTYACTNTGTGGTVVTSGTGTSFTFTPAANDVMACTFTNTRKSATLTLRKTWVAGVSGDTATVTSTGFINNASSGSSTSSGSNTTAGSAVTVYAGETGSISEAFGVGSSASYTASLACSGNTTALSGSSLTIDAADTAIVCTFTNTKKSKITLIKTVGGRVNSGDEFTVSASGGATASVTTVSPALSATATFYSSPGAALTLTDAAAGTTALSDYDSRLTCTNALSGTAGYTANASLPSSLSATSASLTPVAGDDITCTYTNTPKPRISLQKVFSAAGGGRVASTDQFILAMTGATPVTTTGVGSSVASAAVSLVATAGTAITLSETAAVTTPATNLANYTTTYACTNTGTGGTTVTTGTGTSFTFTPANNDVMACTFTNTRKSATLTLRKTWVAGVSGDTATVTSTGFINNATSDLSTSSGSNTTAGSSVTVYAGETGSIVEALGGTGSYTASLACSGNTVPLSGSSLTIDAADSALVCTFTNTGGVRITLAKTVGGRVNSGDQFTVSASGGGTLQGTSSVTTAGTATSAATTFYSSPGAALTLTDAAAGTTVLGNYDSRLTCTNALSGTAGYTLNSSLPNNASTTSASITPAIGDDITCTYTNTPKPQVSLQKVFTAAGGGRVASTDQFILAITGATPVTTTGDGSSVTSAAVSLAATAGTAITLTETVAATTPATNLGNYTTSYACTNSGTGGTVVTSGTGTSFTFTPAINDVMACTFTNTRKSATLTLRKTWDSGVSGDTATVTSTGFINNASSGLSTSSGSNTTAGSAVTVYAGETGSIDEAFGTVAASYTASVACSGNATPLSGSSLTVNAADAAIVCTLTNVGAPLPNRLAPNGAQTAQPGTAVFYAHTFNASSAGQVTFALANAATPTGWPWNQVLYRDSDCSGSLDAGETNITAPISVAAGVPLCLVVKQFVPAGIASGAQNITTLSATFSYTANPAWPNALLSVIDVTTVGDASALTLSKRVGNITQGGPVGITVNAKPGDTLQYTLTAVNNGGTALSTLVINDATPAFTTYLSATCPVTLPAVITACSVSVQPAVGTPGNVQWTFNGSLAASGQLAVTYQVKLDQ